MNDTIVRGRARELARVVAAAEACERGTGKLLVVLADSGLGKSQLLEAVERTLSPRFRVLTGNGATTRRSHGLWAAVLRARFGLEERTTEEEVRTRLRAEVGTVLADRKVEDVCFFLGQYLGVSFRDSPLTKALADEPEQVAVLRRAVLRTFFEADARERPLVLVLDDVQATDDDSLGLLQRLAQALPPRVLVVVAARPDLGMRAPELLDPPTERVLLDPLGEAELRTLARELLGELVGEVPLVAEDALVRDVAGNPGLLEQRIQFFKDVGVVLPDDARPGHFRLDLARLDDVRAPASLEDAFAARLAGLSADQRAVFELAALVGQVFWASAVVALARAEHEEPELWQLHAQPDVERTRRTLSELVAKEHLIALPDPLFPGEQEFAFRHRQERERLLSQVGTVRRERADRVLAEWLALFDTPDADESFLVQFAERLERADAKGRAGEVWLRAADEAARAHALRLVIDHSQRGLALLEAGAPRRRIDGWLALGRALVGLGRTDEALAAFREALSLAHQLQLHAKGGAVHNRIGRLYRDRGQLTLARPHLDAGLRLFQLANDQPGVAASHDDIGQLLWVKGDYAEALAQLKFALKLRRQLADRRAIALSLDHIGLVWLDHGDPANAWENLHGVLELRREIGDLYGIPHSLANLGRLAESQGDDPTALARYREALAAAEQVGERNQVAMILTSIGVVLSRLGQGAESVRVLEQAEGLCDRLGDELQLAEAKRGLAKAYLREGRLERAGELVLQAVELFDRTQSRSHRAIALRTLAEVTAGGAFGSDEEGRALDYFMRSAELAQEIGNKTELAKSYRAFARYVRVSRHYKDSERIQKEADKLEAIADDIFHKRREALSARQNERPSVVDR